MKNTIQTDNGIPAASINFDQKQRINLSARAMDMLQMDAAAFGDGMSRTGFLNELLRRCTPGSDASVDTAAMQYREHIEEIWKKSLRKNEAESALVQKGLNALEKDYAQTLAERELSWPKGESLLFRLSNDNCHAFYGDDFGEPPLYPTPACYEGKVSRYLKAILEDYSSHTLYQRESLYFHEEISVIRMAADSGRVVRLSSARVGMDPIARDVRVYAIMPDDSGLYHYIVGMVAPASGTKGDEHVASLRLSRIRSVRIMNAKSARSGHLSSAEKREIEDRIRESRVQFLASDRDDIVVKLSEEGKTAFNRILYMRPKVDYIDSEGNYHFSCSRIQAEYYFGKFGAGAEILLPKELRDRLAASYLSLIHI